MTRHCECGSKVHINTHPTRNRRSQGWLRHYRNHDMGLPRD